MPATVLDAILAPLSAADFMADTWLKKPLHQHGAVDRFAALLGLGDMEHLAGSLPAPYPSWIKLVQEGNVLPPEALSGIGENVNTTKLRQARAAGFTMVLMALNRRWPAIAKLCGEMEAALLGQGVALFYPILANAYATPAKARGFDVHHDDHEVLVLQIAGRKRWRLYQPLDAPLNGADHKALPKESYGQPLRDVELVPGDILYLPRGTPHDASSNDEATLHLTLSINVHTWADLVIAMMKTDPKFRAALPPAAGGSLAQGAAWSAQLAQRLGQFAIAPDNVARAAAGMREGLAAQLDPAPQAQALPPVESMTLNLATRIAITPGGFFQYDKRPNGGVLLYSGGGHRGPTVQEAALRFVAEHASFAVGDIPGLADDAKLALVIALIKQGALVLA